MTITSSKNLNNEQTQPGVFESYIMKLPEILIVALIAFFDLAAIPGLKQLDPLFYSCYVFFFVGIIMIFEYLKRRTLIIPGLIVMSLVLMLISRDMVLTVNILLALGITFFILFIALSRWQKIAFIFFLVFVTANSVACAVTGSDNRFAVICLTVGVFYCVARCIRTDVDYRFAVTFALLFIAFLPIREEPIQWTAVKDVWYRVGSFVDGIGNEIGYQISGIIDLGGSYSGYSSVGNLNGSIKKSSREEIAFDRAGGNDRTLYLKGADYSTITSKGLSGKESISSDYNDWFIVYMNALMDAEVSNREARCFARIESAEVLYEYLRTEDIIRPTNLINIDDEVENGLSHKAGKGFNYKLQYMDIDYASPYFQRVMEGYSGEITHSYDEMKEYVHDTFKINVSRFMSQEGYDAAVARMNSQEYMDELDQYLDTSMSTDKIRNLSQELTANCETDYEKAKVIESYLRNYNYDTSVDLRDSDNFVESFLFDTKSGYCVHFASSMMLLLRDAGVPARYVNGYLYDGSADFVMSSDAHAWVEAYIEGMGWMPFEPTATKESAEDLSWGLVVKEIDEKEQTDWGEYYGEEMVEQMMNEGAEQYDKTSDESEETEEDNSAENREIIKRVLLYAAIIVGAIIALLLVVFAGKRIWFTFLPEDRKLGEMVKKEKKTIEKNMAQDIIEKLHKNSSSIYDYLNYVETDEERVRLKDLFDRYYRVRFRKTGE